MNETTASIPRHSFWVNKENELCMYLTGNRKSLYFQKTGGRHQTVTTRLFHDIMTPAPDVSLLKKDESGIIYDADRLKDGTYVTGPFYAKITWLGQKAREHLKTSDPGFRDPGIFKNNVTENEINVPLFVTCQVDEIPGSHILLYFDKKGCLCGWPVPEIVTDTDISEMQDHMALRPCDPALTDKKACAGFPFGIDPPKRMDNASIEPVLFLRTMSRLNQKNLKVRLQTEPDPESADTMRHLIHAVYNENMAVEWPLLVESDNSPIPMPDPQINRLITKIETVEFSRDPENKRCGTFDFIKVPFCIRSKASFPDRWEFIQQYHDSFVIASLLQITKRQLFVRSGVNLSDIRPTVIRLFDRIDLVEVSFERKRQKTES